MFQSNKFIAALAVFVAFTNCTSIGVFASKKGRWASMTKEDVAEEFQSDVRKVIRENYDEQPDKAKLFESIESLKKEHGETEENFAERMVSAKKYYEEKQDFIRKGYRMLLPGASDLPGSTCWVSLIEEYDDCNVLTHDEKGGIMTCMLEPIWKKLTEISRSGKDEQTPYIHYLSSKDDPEVHLKCIGPSSFASDRKSRVSDKDAPTPERKDEKSTHSSETAEEQAPADSGCFSGCCGEENSKTESEEKKETDKKILDTTDSKKENPEEEECCSTCCCVTGITVPIVAVVGSFSLYYFLFKNDSDWGCKKLVDSNAAIVDDDVNGTNAENGSFFGANNGTQNNNGNAQNGTSNSFTFSLLMLGLGVVLTVGVIGGIKFYKNRQNNTAAAIRSRNLYGNNSEEGEDDYFANDQLYDSDSTHGDLESDSDNEGGFQ